jgi:hypothetical protein
MEHKIKIPEVPGKGITRHRIELTLEEIAKVYRGGIARLVPAIPGKTIIVHSIIEHSISEKFPIVIEYEYIDEVKDVQP